jgi:peptidoglycan hydrolase CwlO-like protein
VHDELLNAKFEIGRLSNQVESLSAQVERFQETNSVLNAKIIRLERELIEE